MEWKFVEDLEPLGSGDTWYDLTDGGYIKPEDILKEDEQLEIIQNAIQIVRGFIYALEDAELLNEF